MGRRGELQVPWCLAGAGRPAQARPLSGVLCAGELGRGTKAEAAGARPRVEPAARRRHAGQLGQQRVPRAPAPHAGALAADLSDQPYHLFYEGFRPSRGPASDPRERYEPQPGLAPRGPPTVPGPPAPVTQPGPPLHPRPHLLGRPNSHTHQEPSLLYGPSRRPRTPGLRPLSNVRGCLLIEVICVLRLVRSHSPCTLCILRFAQQAVTEGC